MKTKNKNYEEYIDCYEDSWKDVLDIISDKIKIDTLGGAVCAINTDQDAGEMKVLVLYCHNDQDAFRKYDIIKNLGYNASIISGYGPDMIIIDKEREVK